MHVSIARQAVCLVPNWIEIPVAVTTAAMTGYCDITPFVIFDFQGEDRRRGIARERVR